jgi:hypothetical protein
MNDDNEKTDPGILHTIRVVEVRPGRWEIRVQYKSLQGDYTTKTIDTAATNLDDAKLAAELRFALNKRPGQWGVGPLYPKTWFPA